MTYGIEDIVEKIIGKIQPIGETNEDAKRTIALEHTINLAQELIDRIILVSKNKDRQEFSVKYSGKIAYRFIENLKEQIEELNK